MKIKNLRLFLNFDTRGKETLKVGIENEKGNWFYGNVGSGKSKGKKEVISKNFQEIKEIEKFLTVFKNLEVHSLIDFEKKLFEIDASKSNLGGNVFLGCLLAVGRALSYENGLQLWQLLKHEYSLKDENKQPFIFSNMINGGVHVDNNLDLQEYLLVIKYENEKTIQNLINFYYFLGEELKKRYSLRILPLGDESGYALDFANNLEPLTILQELAQIFLKDKNFYLGIDCAASTFFHNGYYFFETQKLTSDELIGVYLNFREKVKELYFLEDPLAEEDIDGFQKIKSLNLFKIIGDDLTVTNPQIVKKMIDFQAIDGVIVKANQIGSLYETIETVKIAKENNLSVIVSHRSGETEDNFLIHLARAVDADGLKIGVPFKERIIKFNELIVVYGNSY